MRNRRGGQHSYHLNGVSVDGHRGSHDTRVGTEPAYPEAVRQDRRLTASKDCVLFREAAAQKRLDSQHVQEISSYTDANQSLRLPGARECVAANIEAGVISGDALEGATEVAEVAQ